MTDPLAFLAAALDAAQRDADAAGEDGGSVWSTGRHFAVRDENDDPVAYNEGYPTQDQAKHIARHDPASVLRRIAADRKMLAECVNVLDGWRYGETKELADTIIRNMAEGWGWSEETT